MMTEFLFVRHCESEMNCTPEIIGGRSNFTPATKRGEAQAALLGQYLKAEQYRPDAVYSSGAIRADTTARIALEHAGIAADIIIDERLQELSQGIYEGHPRIDVYTPEIIALYGLAELQGKFPQGESIIDAHNRADSVVNDIHRAHPKGTFLIFSHGLLIRSYVGVKLGRTKQQILVEETPNVSLTKVTIDDGQPKVWFLGKTVISE